jgi:uncharacterized protein (TIGR02246 family)
VKHVTDTEPQQIIRRLRESYMRAQDAGDAEACVAHWADDGVLLPPNEPAVSGREALISWYRRVFNESRFAFRISFDEIQVVGGWSFARGSYAGSIIPKDGSEPIHEEGKYLEIHKRDADGSWKFARHIWNSDRSP